MNILLFPLGGKLIDNLAHKPRIPLLYFITHVADLKIASIQALETRKGNPQKGQLRMAATITGEMEGGAIASIDVNYLNQESSGQWGNDVLYLHGVNGFAESIDGGARTRLVLREVDRGPVPNAEPSQDYLTLFLKHQLEDSPMPIDLEYELSPTRWIIRAKQGAK